MTAAVLWSPNTQAPIGLSAAAPVWVQEGTSPNVASTGTLTSVASANADTSLLATNTSRKAAVVTNESTAIMYLLVGSGTASATNYTYSVPATSTTSTSISIRDYTGPIRAFWAAANGFARITEYT